MPRIKRFVDTCLEGSKNWNRATQTYPDPAFGMGATLLEPIRCTPATIIGAQRDPAGGWMVTTIEDRIAKNGDKDVAKFNEDGQIRYFRTRPDEGIWEQVYRNGRGRWCLVEEPYGLLVGRRIIDTRTQED